MRWLHLVAVGVALGGAVLLWIAADVPQRLARRFEYTFWGAIGVIVLAGIGNLGALSPAIPGLDSNWGRLFGLKLLVVLGLLAMSAVRTGLVCRPSSDGSIDSERSHSDESTPTGWWYGATAVIFAVIVALAVVMVRG